MIPYYERDGIAIYCGDARELLPEIAGDVLITDPPYGVNIGSHAAASDGKTVGRRHNALVKKLGYDLYDDTPENFDAVVGPIVRAALAKTRRGAVFCAGNMVWRLPPADAVGGVFMPAAVGRSAWGYTSLAVCLLYGKAPDIHKGAKPTAIWSTDSAKPNGHPCPKPLSWMRWAVSLASREGETVLDPMMGSGTTLLAARLLGRRAIGIEISEAYCEIAAKSLEDPPLLAALESEQPSLWDAS